MSNVGSDILVRLVDVHKLLQRPMRLAEMSVHFDVAGGGRTKGDEAGGDALDDVQVVLEVDDDVLRARVEDVVEHRQRLCTTQARVEEVQLRGRGVPRALGRERDRP